MTRFLGPRRRSRTMWRKRFVWRRTAGSGDLAIEQRWLIGQCVFGAWPTLECRCRQSGLVARISDRARSTVALAPCGCDPPLAPPLLDLSSRPDFAVKAGRILDLYQRHLGPRKRSAMTNSWSRPMRKDPVCRPGRRRHATVPTRPAPMKVEHEWHPADRMAAWSLLGPPSGLESSVVAEHRRRLRPPRRAGP